MVATEKEKNGVTK